MITLALAKSMAFGRFLRISKEVILDSAAAGVIIGVSATEARKLLRTKQ